ncbi:MAG: CoB--CoM heterodisulfide reductase iron-sulfur subunit A family protein [Planctomycetes bacterium]|nr:CoB--CoM heterodisulfide reductase iron-sulfur subunit A family protein [Planctomycetota bacterium]
MSEQPVLVIGGGPAGIEAARGIADVGYNAILVEKRNVLGGTPELANYAALTPDFRDAGEAMAEMAATVTNNPNVDLRLGSTVTATTGSSGNFEVTIKNSKGSEKVSVGSVVIATGFQHFDPGRETQQYGYYEYDDVITLVDLEKMLKAKKVVKPSNGEPPKRLCFIQCVGSRDRQIGNEYCSKVCCGVAAKESIEVRQLVPDCKVFIFYIDMRMYGYWENEIYWPSQEKYKVNYIKGIATEIIKKGDRLLVRGEDTTMGRPMEVPMDIVVLSVGMEPSAGTREMAAIFEVKLNKYNFIETTGGALNTVGTSVEGVFACGATTGPADLEDSISSASAAAMKAITVVRKSAMAG